MKIAFYNVENLFDTLDDPYVNDNAFLTESALRWDQKRYVLKLQRLARVIKAIDEPMPMAIGLAEVENRKVLENLVAAMDFTEKEVGIVHIESPDERGMDVGLLYNRKLIKSSENNSYSIQFKSDLSDKTRDILHVKAELRDGEYLHFFVNHWPSRKEGAKISLIKRIEAAETLNWRIEDLLGKEPAAKVIVMGDFNCDPESAPVRNILDIERSESGILYNLSWEMHQSREGSLNFKGKWLMFDQILVNENLINNSSGIKLEPESFNVFKRDWMLFYNPKYRDFRPNKTYGGRKYHGGFSDHLPVYIKLK